MPFAARVTALARVVAPGATVLGLVAGYLTRVSPAWFVVAAALVGVAIALSWSLVCVGWYQGVQLASALTRLIYRIPVKSAVSGTAPIAIGRIATTAAGVRFSLFYALGAKPVEAHRAWVAHALGLPHVYRVELTESDRAGRFEVVVSRFQ